jgi:ABC-type uncharacterized transport system permease subunit
MRRLAFAALVVLVLAWGASPAAAQCAMCKTFLTSSPEGQRIARDFNLGILVMLFAPYVVFGAFTAFAFRSQIRQRLVRVAPRLFR